MRTHSIEELSFSQRLTLLLEDDAAQLGMELVTYYMLCSVVGLLQAASLARCWGLM